MDSGGVFNGFRLMLVEDHQGYLIILGKRTLKFPLKIECPFATSAHVERYVASLVRGRDSFR